MLSFKRSTTDSHGINDIKMLRQFSISFHAQMPLNLAPFGRRTLREKAAQRPDLERRGSRNMTALRITEALRV